MGKQECAKRNLGAFFVTQKQIIRRYTKQKMKLTIIRIENEIVTCKIEEDETLIDIGKRWFAKDIEVGQVIEFEYYTK